LRRVNSSGSPGPAAAWRDRGEAALAAPPLSLIVTTAYVVCGGVAAAVVSVLVARALWPPGVVASGCAAVTDVTTMPVTAPLTLFLCLEPAVCRAARVALRFAAAAAHPADVGMSPAFSWPLPADGPISLVDPRAPSTDSATCLVDSRACEAESRASPLDPRSRRANGYRSPPHSSPRRANGCAIPPHSAAPRANGSTSPLNASVRAANACASLREGDSNARLSRVSPHDSFPHEANSRSRRSDACVHPSLSSPHAARSRTSRAARRASRRISRRIHAHSQASA
jgi:hypothetical protein